MRALRKIRFISFSISLALITVMLWVYGGLRVHAENYVAYSKRPVSLAAPPSRFDELLSEIKGVVKQSSSKTKSAPEKGFDNIEKLTALKENLEQEHEKSQDYFASIESAIKKKKLPDEILNRHREFVQQYESKYGSLLEHLESIESANTQTRGFWARLIGAKKNVDWDGVIGKTLAFLEKNTPSAPQRHFDPKNLPHQRALKADKPIPPKLTKKEWAKAFPKESVGKRLAPAGKASPIRLAATTQSTPADLEETIEVKFTPEIRQLADSLGKNPVKIFNWVRNNIEFVPTWGSIQGAQLCLESRIGNAFDTASLLIALLRYSGISARYQMGTIEVPIDKAMNWLGGFTEPQAAARFAASGGIPSAGTVEQGGVLRSIRMEHAWVKAYLDYAPSQGEINIQSDTWVDLDPSFKRYQHTPGVDIEGVLAFDTTSIQNHLDSTTTFNEYHAITNIDHDFIRSAASTSITNVVNAFPGADLSTLLPARSIIARNSSVIPVGHPYKVLVKVPDAAILPSELRHTIAISIADNFGGTHLTYSASLPELATKTLSLYFTLASQADIDFVKSVAPPEFFDPNATGRVQRFLDAIPAHLVGVRPVIQLNGVAVATGSSVGMGDAQIATVRFSAPTISTADVTLDLVAWGRFGVTLDYAGISESMVRARNEKFRALIQEIQNANGQGVSAGPVMSAAHDLIISSWFFSVDQTSELMSKALKVRYARYPSIGFAYPEFRVTTTFGVPNRLSGRDFFLDIARQFHIVAAFDGAEDKEKGFNITTGYRASQLEGTILARLLSGSDTPPPGISAVSALRSASLQGIPIHAIHATNVGTVLPLIANSFPKEAISNVVNTGRIVFVPQSPPVIDGMSVNGYITLDPQSGEGAYLIGRAGAGNLRLKCNSDLNPDEKATCEMWLGIADILEGIGTAILFGLALAVIGIAFYAAILALVAATAAGAAFVAVGGVIIIGFTTALVIKTMACYEECVRTRSIVPGCELNKDFIDAYGCGAYATRLLALGFGIDDIFELIEEADRPN